MTNDKKLTTYLVLKFLNKNGMTAPVAKLDITTGSQNGISVCSSDTNIRQSIPTPIAICRTKYIGSRSSFPLKNNLAENHPISNMIPPNV